MITRMSMVALGEGGVNCKAKRLEGDEVGGIKDAFRGLGWSGWMYHSQEPHCHLVTKFTTFRGHCYNRYQSQF